MASAAAGLARARLTCRPTRLASALALALGASVLPFAAAHAQAAPERQLATVPVTSSAAASDGYTPAVTTTGSKIAVPLADLPASVSIVPKEAIEEQAAKTLSQALSNASGPQPVYGGGYGYADAFVIRGLRARLLRDGLPDGPSMLNYARSFADVESLEILKGPGSAIYGNGAPGGVINLVTKQPLQEFHAEGLLSVGGLGLRQASADVTGPLSAQWAGRLIANDYHTDGYRGLEADVRELVTKLEYRPDGVNRVRLGWDHRENRNVVDNYGLLFNTSGQIVTAPRESRYYSPFNRTRQDIDRLTAVHEHDFSPAASLRTAIVFDRRDADVIRNAGGNPVNAAGAFTGRNGRTQTDASQFTNVSTELTWKPAGAVRQTVLFGAEYERVRDDTVRLTYTLPNIPDALAPVVPETTLDGVPLTRAFGKTIGSDTLSLYAQDQVEFSRQWKGRAGVRIDRARWFDEGFGNSLAVPTVANVQRKLEAEKTLPSWQAGLVYQPSRHLSFFGGYTRGRFLAIQSESVNVDRAPELSSQFELGVKTTWLDEKLNVNLTFFDTRRKNYLVALTPGTDPLPVGQSKSRGMELDVIGNPVRGWNVIGSFSHVDARATGSELASVSGITTGAGESVNGKFLAATPRNALSLWTRYELQSGPLQGLGFGIGAVHRDATYVDSLEKLRVPGSTIYNAAVSYRMRRAELALNVKNLTNRSYYAVPTFAGALTGDPRQVVVSLKVAM